MQGKWSIDGFDLSPYLLEGGVAYGKSVRASRDIVTMSGVLHRKEVRKRTISLSLVTVSDSTLKKLAAAIPARGVLEYPEENGTQSSGTFYFSALQYTAKVVRGGNTYYSGLTLDAEER